MTFKKIIPKSAIEEDDPRLILITMILFLGLFISKCNGSFIPITVSLITISGFAIFFLCLGVYSKVVFFWIDFLPIVNLVFWICTGCVLLLYSIELLLKTIFSSYALLNSEKHNNDLRQAISSTKKMTQHIRDIKIDSGDTSDKLTLELLRESKNMIEALEEK